MGKIDGGDLFPKEIEYRIYQGSALTLDDLASPAFVGRRQEHFACRASTRLSFLPAWDGTEAGLTVLMNEQHHYEIALTRLAGQLTIIVRRRIGDLCAIVAQMPVDAEVLELSIQADADAYTFACTLPGQSERTLATGRARYLGSEVAGGYTGVYFGVYATSRSQERSALADFDWFEYRPLLAVEM